MAKFKIIVISIAIFIIALLYTPLIQLVASPLIIKDPIKKADAIVVLSGGWESKNKLSKSTMERYKYGIKLFQKGYAKYIIFSGGNQRGNPSEAEAMTEMAMSDGFSEDTIITEGDSESTWENTLFVKKLLMEKDLNSVVLVTSPYHALRAKTMFEDKDINTISAPVPDSEFYNAYGTERIQIAKTIFLEYLKLGLYELNLRN